MKTVRTRKRGKTFSYIFEAGKVNNKRHVIEKGGFPTREAAYSAGVDAYNKWQHGNLGIMSKRVLLKDFAVSWLDNVMRLNLKSSTLVTYRATIKGRILPYLGEVPVQDITPRAVDALMYKLTLEKHLAKSTLRDTWRVLRQMLGYAVYPAEIIFSNPADYVRIPKNAPEGVVKRSIISPERFTEILADHPMGTPYHIPLLLLYYTGMRLGEVLGLCWENVDMANGVIHVDRQLYYIPRVGNIFQSPKTKSSKRDIRVPQHLLRSLQRWHVLQQELEDKKGDSYCVVDETDNHSAVVCSKNVARKNIHRQYMVCTNEVGYPVSRSGFLHHLEKYGLNAHSFRHTHATLLAEAGAPPRGIATRLGHKNISVTQNWYTHTTQKMTDDTMKAFENVMENADKNADADKMQTNSKSGHTKRAVSP